MAEHLVRETLEPLVRDRTAADILALRVLDPAMGSGAFLVAACRYLADAYGRALEREGTTGPGPAPKRRASNTPVPALDQCCTAAASAPSERGRARLSAVGCGYVPHREPYCLLRLDRVFLALGETARVSARASRTRPLR